MNIIVVTLINKNTDEIGKNLLHLSCNELSARSNQICDVRIQASILVAACFVFLSFLSHTRVPTISSVIAFQRPIFRKSSLVLQ